MRLHAHSFSRIISLLSPSLFSGAFLFSSISKGRWTIFMRSLSARHSRMIAQGQFLAEFPEKQSDFLFRSAREPLFFALLSVSLHFCPAPMVKSVQKTLKRAFFQAFLSRFERNKNPRKSLEKAWKNGRRKPKNGYFLVKSGFFDLLKKPLRRFQTEFFLKSSKNPTPKRLKNGFWKDFLAVSGWGGPSCAQNKTQTVKRAWSPHSCSCVLTLCRLMFHMKHQKTNERKIFRKIKLMSACLFALFNFFFLQKRIIQTKGKTAFLVSVPLHCGRHLCTGGAWWWDKSAIKHIAKESMRCI